MANKVLQDHLRIGKRLIPPILSHGNFQDVSWVDIMIPELIWIALLNRAYGKQKGAEITRLYAKAIIDIFPNNKLNIGFLSSLENYTNTDLDNLICELNKIKILPFLKSSFRDFIQLYPRCPLVYIFKDMPIKSELNKQYLAEFKILLNKLYDKTSVEATFTIGNLIYSLIVNDILRITENSSMARLPELKDYPNSDISRIIASSNRATVNFIFGDTIYKKDNHWVPYFWNHGFEIEKCKI